MNDSMAFYSDLAEWWPLISPPEEYAGEAEQYAAIFREYSTGSRESLLELGSGGGNNASHLRRAFEHLTLIDIAPAMLDVSRRLNPDCLHLSGDMFSVRLPDRFDCVFVHDAICYATSLEQLRAVFETALSHLKPGGVALFAPDFVRESFQASTEHGGSDDGHRGIRYLEWVWDPDPTDTTYVADYAFLIRDGLGEPQVLRERHVEGLFSKQEWVESIEAVGFRARVVEDAGPGGGPTRFVGIREC